jgi:hypothetical protein
MKRFLALAIGTLVLAQPSFARRGGSDNSGDIITRGSQAWFLSESVEDSVEWLVSSGALLDSALSGAAVDLNTATTATITLATAAGQLTETCVMVDESSRGGTVIKKDTRCGGRPESDTPKLASGSAAWSVVEGIEHSLRLAVAATPAVLSQLSSATSNIQADGSVLVGLELSTGNTLNYSCLKTSPRANKWSLRCSLLN